MQGTTEHHAAAEVSAEMSRSRWWAGQAAAGLALAQLAAACPNPPVVTEIEIVPGTVAVASHVTEPTRFELQARLWSGPADRRRSIIAGSGVKPSWWLSSTGAGVHLTASADGYRATVLLDPGSNPTATMTVKVDVGSIGAQSFIVPSALSAEDLAEAGYADGMPPDVPIVAGDGQPSPIRAPSGSRPPWFGWAPRERSRRRASVLTRCGQWLCLIHRMA